MRKTPRTTPEKIYLRIGSMDPTIAALSIFDQLADDAGYGPNMEDRRAAWNDFQRWAATVEWRDRAELLSLFLADGGWDRLLAAKSKPRHSSPSRRRSSSTRH